MKRSDLTLIFTTIVLLFYRNIYPDNGNIGRLIKSQGEVKITNINCNDDQCRTDKNLIYPGDRIITGKNSSASIMLNDGTAVIVLEHSDTIIYSIVNRKEKKLTSLFSDYGKFRIIQQNDFTEASLVFKSRTSVIKSVCSTFDFITGSREAGIFTYRGEAGFASSDPSVSKAYIVKEGNEAFLVAGKAPSTPVKVNLSLRSSWLQRHFLTADRTGIRIYKNSNGPADWFFIEKQQ